MTLEGTAFGMLMEFVANLSKVENMTLQGRLSSNPLFLREFSFSCPSAAHDLSLRLVEAFDLQ